MSASREERLSASTTSALDPAAARRGVEQHIRTVHLDADVYDVLRGVGGAVAAEFDLGTGRTTASESEAGM